MNTTQKEIPAYEILPYADRKTIISAGEPEFLEPNTPLRGVYPDGQARRRERRSHQKHNRNTKR